MSDNHPYRRLPIPPDAPFELRPSPGKGWGAFATRPITKNDIILREKPMFIIRKPKPATTEADVRKAFQRLTLEKKHQFLSLRDNGTRLFPSMAAAYDQNTFTWSTESAFVDPEDGKPQASGVFILSSRFNNSCVSNAKFVPGLMETQEIFAARDIAAGEEITICYNTTCYGWTLRERQRDTLFVCDCKACQPGTTFQRLSDMRRRLFRGLRYLASGEDVHMLGSGCETSVILDPQLRKAAETFDLPMTSRFVYNILMLILLEEEGLADDIVVRALSRSLTKTVLMLESESTARVASLALEQDSMFETLRVAFGIYGRKDGGDIGENRMLSLFSGSP